MSFDTICKGCGASSGPSVGVCPYCKTVMAGPAVTENITLGAFNRMYLEGKLDAALRFGNGLYKSKPELKTDLPFIMTYVKVLIETEAPSSQMRALLAEAQLANPQDAGLLDYFEIVEAKNYLKKGANDPGEIMLKSIIRRSPQNVHAHFLLGTHWFWSEKDAVGAIPHLETCVRLHPNFLRAWGCLGAVYQKMGNKPLAQQAFRKCAALETNLKMKEFFEQQAA